MVWVRVVDALPTGRLEAALDITFEYLRATQHEAGRLVPQHIHDLPAPLRAALDTLEHSHRSPGGVLLAINGEQDAEQLVGTVAMRPHPSTRPTDAVVQRLYVRPEHRRAGIARLLMAHVQAIAVRHGFDRLVLNVMTGRTGALALYESLGYLPMPEPEGWTWGGRWLCRETQQVSTLDGELTPHDGNV